MPDDYLRKLKQDLAEANGRKTGGFATLMPEDAWHAVEVCREQDPLVSCRVQLRLEAEHPGPPKRQRPADRKQ